MDITSIKDIDLQGKRVLIRCDFNVPMDHGVVVSDIRIKASLDTIKWAIEQGAKILLCSHLGRPKEGFRDSEFSLGAILPCLTESLSKPVRLVTDYLEGIEFEGDEILLLENVRYNLGEKTNDSKLAKAMAALCDVFVMDAFGSSHRSHASTVGVAKYAEVACAGLLLMAELKALGQVMVNPQRPVVAIVGGSKVSTKFKVLKALMERVDQLIVGGGIANTFLAATGQSVGCSLYEPDWVDSAKILMQSTSEEGGMIPLPVDLVVAKEFSAEAKGEVCDLANVDKNDMILDVGPRTAAHFAELIKGAGTIIWNGPLGVFEFDEFSHGTQVLAQAVAESDGFSLAGGGDTLAAIEKYQLSHRIDYISTGGGAFLEFLEGKKLPAVQVLEDRSAQLMKGTK